MSSNLNSRRLANLQEKSQTTSNKNLFDWKPINNNRKVFTPNTNYSASGRNSVRSNSSTSRTLKPIERCNSLKELNANNNNNSNENSDFKLEDLESKSSSRFTNFKRFDDLFEQNNFSNDEKKSLVRACKLKLILFN